MLRLKLVLSTLIAVSVVVRRVGACGGFFCEPQQPVVQAGEAIAFGVNLNDAEEGENVTTTTTTVTMHVQILYEGPAENFSWLLPIPFQPELSVGSEVLFQSLFQQTLPQFSIDIQTLDDTTCNLAESPATCAPVPEAAPVDSPESDGATVLDQGSVGPFDFVVIEAAEKNPDSVRQWLIENGYDEYEGSAALLNYYALMEHKFVALRLRKDKDTGDIQPIVLTYDMPTHSKDTTELAIACVPIKLTAVAANNDMPVQVYVLGKYRATPINFFEVELDDGLADWLGCQFSPNCFINDLRNRFAAAVAATSIDNHAFMTEYAGTSSIMANQVEIEIDVDELATLTTPSDFLNALLAANIPGMPLMDTIVNKYIPKQFVDGAPDFCTALPSLYVPSNQFQMFRCLDYITTQTVDAAEFAAELKMKVFDPADDAQQFVDSHPYLTRLYAEMSPNNMNKDPFFSFDPDLPDISNVHAAVAVPVCGDDVLKPFALDIRVNGMDKVTRLPATYDGCSFWRRTDSSPLFSSDLSPAIRLVASRFGEEQRMSLERSQNGTFSDQEILGVVTRLDARVVDQTVPEYVAAPTPNPPPSPGTTSATRKTRAKVHLAPFVLFATVSLLYLLQL